MCLGGKERKSHLIDEDAKKKEGKKWSTGCLVVPRSPLIDSMAVSESGGPGCMCSMWHRQTHRAIFFSSSNQKGRCESM